jgi:peptidyl-prolyl cis-trans isomerase A (cyclophilin A)
MTQPLVRRPAEGKKSTAILPQAPFSSNLSAVPFSSATFTRPARPLRSSLAFHRLSLALSFALSLTLAGVPARAQSATPPSLPDAPSTTAQPKSEPVPTGPTVVIDTSMGRLTCKTFAAQAPMAVANFIGLAEGTKQWTDSVTNLKQHSHRFYDGLTFHRVIPGFMIQGGDPAGDGSGDPGYLFADEIDPSLTFSVPGRLAMANSGPGTNGSQFFITEQASAELNGRYTLFGQCDAHSVLLAASIARVERDKHDKPLTPVVITRVTIVRDGQPMPPLPAAPVAPAAPAATPTPAPPTTP